MRFFCNRCSYSFFYANLFFYVYLILLFSLLLHDNSLKSVWTFSGMHMQCIMQTLYFVSISPEKCLYRIYSVEIFKQFLRILITYIYYTYIICKLCNDFTSHTHHYNKKNHDSYTDKIHRIVHLLDSDLYNYIKLIEICKISLMKIRFFLLLVQYGRPSMYAEIRLFNRE